MRTIVHSVRTFVLICFILPLCFRSNAQSVTTGNGKVEFGLGIGPLFFLGDLGGNHGEGTRFVKDVNFPVTNLAKGLHATIYPAEWIGFRVAINQGRLEGFDSLINDKGGAETYRKERNLHFRSNMWEAYAGIEIYPTIFMEMYDGLQGKLRPYGVIGVGAFKFNPKARYITPDGREQWIALKPLHTEGQGFPEYPERKEYSLTSLEIPIGGGFKYYLRENFYVGFELMHRKSFTDYVDDVSTTYIDNNLFATYLAPEQAAQANQVYYRGATSATRPSVGEQRGNPKQNDSFFSTIIRCGWRLNDSNTPNGRAARQMRCPAFY